MGCVYLVCFVRTAVNCNVRRRSNPCRVASGDANGAEAEFLRFAAATGALSPSRFAHTFTAAFGVSPQTYVESCRLEYANRLL